MTRVRFAPSPTGNLHLGGARTALYNWMYARQTDGEYVVRLEDTDRARSTPESEAQIMRTLDWLGLGADSSAPDNVRLTRQSDRTEIYDDAMASLRDSGFLYPCADSEPDELGRVPMRGRVEGSLNFNDEIYGAREFHGDNIENPILVRSDGTPTYNLACAIDDLETGITHVIRGDDHFSNTPIQVAAMRALGHDAPNYAHLPMILGPDGQRLSKRHGAASVEDYYAYLPESLLAYLAFLGWSPENITHDTLLTAPELAEHFSLDRVGRAPAQYNRELLDHMQSNRLRDMAQNRPDEWKSRFDSWSEAHGENKVDIDDAFYLAHDKAANFAEADRLVYPISVDTENLAYEDEISFSADERPILLAARVHLGRVDEWNEQSVGQALRDMCKELEMKPREAIPVVQQAMMGQKRGTSVFRVIDLLGKDAAFDRLERAQNVEFDIDKPSVDTQPRLDMN